MSSKSATRHRSLQPGSRLLCGSRLRYRDLPHLSSYLEPRSWGWGQRWCWRERRLLDFKQQRPLLWLPWRSSERATPRCAAVARELLWVKGSRKTALSRKTLRPSFFFLKAGDEIAVGKLSLWQKESDTLVIKEWEVGKQRLCTHRPGENNSHRLLDSSIAKPPLTTAPLCPRLLICYRWCMDIYKKPIDFGIFITYLDTLLNFHYFLIAFQMILLGPLGIS